MTPQEQEIGRLKDKIKKNTDAILTDSMTIFDRNIPENDDRKSAELILAVMQDALDELKKDVANGKYDYY